MNKIDFHANTVSPAEGRSNMREIVEYLKQCDPNTEISSFDKVLVKLPMFAEYESPDDMINLKFNINYRSELHYIILGIPIYIRNTIGRMSCYLEFMDVYIREKLEYNEIDDNMSNSDIYEKFIDDFITPFYEYNKHILYEFNNFRDNYIPKISGYIAAVDPFPELTKKLDEVNELYMKKFQAHQKSFIEKYKDLPIQ